MINSMTEQEIQGLKSSKHLQQCTVIRANENLSEID